MELRDLPSSKLERDREQIRAGFRSLGSFQRLAMLDELERCYCFRCGCMKGKRVGCRCEEYISSRNTSSPTQKASTE
jgi:hypothetical protein